MDNINRETIKVNKFSEIGDLINQILRKNLNVKLDMQEISDDERNKTTKFLEGIVYILDGTLKIENTTYEITLRGNYMTTLVEYCLKKDNLYEQIITSKSELYDSADALASGKTVIIDLSKIDEKVQYFHFISGVAFGLYSTIDRIDEHIFKFKPYVTVLKDDLKEKSLYLNNKISNLNALSKSKQKENIPEMIEIFQEYIDTQDLYELLTPLRETFSEYLSSIGKERLALQQLDDYCILFLKKESRNYRTFERVIRRSLKKHTTINGMGEMKQFINELFLLCEENTNSDYKISMRLRILNAAVDIMINQKQSADALRMMSHFNKEVSISECEKQCQLAYRLAQAHAKYRLGHFHSSKRILKKYFSDKIVAGMENEYYFINARRLLATIDSSQGKLKNAMEIYKELFAIYENNLDKYDLIYSYDSAHLASLYFNKKNYKHSEKCYLTAIKYCKDKEQLAIHYHNLGTCYMKQNELYKAKELFVKSINTNIELSDDPFYVYAEEISASQDYLVSIAALIKQNK
ncbi:MAG: cell division protein SepF [Bacillota bacterium]|nr:cell division protein SepF [Bacillota bacterium]